MDRHAVGDGGPPAGIGARVEGSVEFHSRDNALRVTADAATHPGGVAFGGGGHAFGAAVDHPHWAAQPQRGKAKQRLQAEIELGAEAAPHGAGQDADAIRRQGKDGGGFVAVHHGGLGAGADAEGFALKPGRAGLGFDIGVFDEGGGDLGRDDMRGSGHGGGGISFADKALNEDVARATRMQGGGGLLRGIGIGERR